MPLPDAAQPPRRIVIREIAPQVDCGRHPAKRCVGEPCVVSADVFRDGHEQLRAAVQFRRTAADDWSEAPMRHLDAHVNGVRWQGELTPDACGRWQYRIAAWTDPFASWRSEVARKLEAGQADLSGEVSEGRVLLEDAIARADKADAKRLQAAVKATTAQDPTPALDADVAAAVERSAERHELTTSPALELHVDRERARFGAWYELFPRSWGGFAGVTEQVPKLAELGFDVLYLPPIHPIGRKNRKGRNNALVAEPGDPGSPWAVGAEEGGHDAIHPELGTEQEFDALVAAAREHGIDIALDFAIQCSADHPWLTEHPEWFNRRPDGTLKYAENPPKKYQDIYNVNFDSEDWRGLWQALFDVVRHWVDKGVRVFRVDNPHTKPVPFWEWLIGEIHATDPDVVFLAEAFTKRRMMQQLAKIGFNQSYTYFTWKNSSWELREYLTELAHTDEVEYFRPNFFANTPDILHEHLVHGGPPAFAGRLVLAATLSPSYGIYSGYEHFENVPVRAGSEEYLDSEKYETKRRALDGPLLPFVKRINAIRRENPALHHLRNIEFLPTENDALLAYSKRAGSNHLICVVNLDPHHAQEGVVIVPAHAGTPPAFAVTDLIDGRRYDWRMGRNYVRLEPWERVAHVLRTDAP